MNPERKTYGWKLATFRLPTDVYYFEVKSSVRTEDDPDLFEIELRITTGDYTGHRLRMFAPADEWKYPPRFSARLHADYGIIVPDTVNS
jgi:hypothetical protein